MAVMTIWASIMNQAGFFDRLQWLLFSINGFIVLVVFWITAEGIFCFFKTE
jgi:hypothetical protein